jgi:nucleotide-binding universal stress UspA family protein
VLANVQEPASLYELVVSRDPGLIAAASVEAGEHLMAPARVLLQAAGLGCETAVGVGDPAHVLVDLIESSGCDMVIIGARGQGAISSALLGSVSQELAHASPVPVTIVKHAELLEQEDDVEGAADVAA